MCVGFLKIEKRWKMWKKINSRVLIKAKVHDMLENQEDDAFLDV